MEEAASKFPGLIAVKHESHPAIWDSALGLWDGPLVIVFCAHIVPPTHTLNFFL